jgi:hypothetical protein
MSAAPRPDRSAHEPARPRAAARRAVGERGGALFDALFFVAVTGLTAALLVLTTILPAARKAARAEREVRAEEVRVDRARGEVERLRTEITALESDPWFIERTLKRKMKALRPDLFPAEPLPPTATATPAPPP